ncbi:hypothetical protein PRIPAC_72069 [Pristionchus pacificus]|uniref:Uncharacterized protein n=1 Tax=Pristionchus pacificus TaxID=54126 RepID=A0A2A6BEM4_PRIPA|nr:hypothetical protein PRIPAC_72069 [Pristionchus pacificus]|eukprot:PDM64306.1 hypothetical protein PRIPAC_52562 [Pristionchus pacificus]
MKEDNDENKKGQLGKGNDSVPATDWEMHGNTAASTDLKGEITVNSRNGRKKRDESRKSEQPSGRSDAKKNKEQRQKEEYDETVRMLSLAFGCAIGALILITQKREELTAANGLTIIRREGMADKYVVKGCDFRIRGPLVRGRVHAEPPTKHALDDQVGGDKIDDIFFDKNLNDAYFIGEGVEIVEEDSVSVSEGKDSKGNAIELLAMMDADDMMAINSQKSKKNKVDPNAAKNPRAKMSSKSSKSKRRAKPTANPLNPPSSGSNPKKTSSSGSSGKKK